MSITDMDCAMMQDCGRRRVGIRAFVRAGTAAAGGGHFVWLVNGGNKETLGCDSLVVEDLCARSASPAANIQQWLAPAPALTSDTDNMLVIGRGEAPTIREKKEYDDEGE